VSLAHQNVFKYLTAHHGSDWLCHYGADITADTALIDNPTRRPARNAVKRAEATVADAQHALAELLRSDTPIVEINTTIPAAPWRRLVHPLPDGILHLAVEAHRGLARQRLLSVPAAAGVSGSAACTRCSRLPDANGVFVSVRAADDLPFNYQLHGRGSAFQLPSHRYQPLSKRILLLCRDRYTFIHNLHGERHHVRVQPPQLRQQLPIFAVHDVTPPIAFGQVELDHHPPPLHTQPPTAAW